MSLRQQNLIPLFESLSDRLGESDLQTLCLYLGVDHEDLSGKGKQDKVRELLIYLERRDRLGDLVREGKRIRPDILWDNLLESEESSSVELQLLPDYPYEHFTNSFRDVIGPLHFQSTGSIMNIVFGNIAEVEQTTIVAPINQSFDFWQRGSRSVLASFEKILVDGQRFFDYIERVWPEYARPKNAGIGYSHFMKLPQNSLSLEGAIFVVTTRNLSNNHSHYGRYVNTPLEGIDYVLDNVLRCVKDKDIKSVALPLLGTGYANVNFALTPQFSLLIKKIVTGLTIKKLEDYLSDRESELRRGIIVMYSSQPHSNEEHQLWDFVLKFVKAEPQKRTLQLDELVQQMKELSV